MKQTGKRHIIRFKLALFCLKVKSLCLQMFQVIFIPSFLSPLKLLGTPRYKQLPAFNHAPCLFFPACQDSHSTVSSDPPHRRHPIQEFAAQLAWQWKTNFVSRGKLHIIFSSELGFRHTRVTSFGSGCSLSRPG